MVSTEGMHAETVAEETFARLTSRMRRFRDASRARGATPPPAARRLHFEEAFFDRYQHRPFWERYARSMASALEQEPVHLFDDELLVGMLYQTAPPPADYVPDKERWLPFDANHHASRLMQEEVHPSMARSGAPGHVGWRWDRILRHGIAGHIELIRRHLATARDAEARRLYRGALILWRSVLRWADRHVQALREKLDAAPEEERARLLRLLDVCERVPRSGARNFHEAVQSFYFQHLAVMFENPYGGNGPGRLDYFLWPHLEADLARGAITMDEAKELITELFIRFHERLQNNDAWVEAVMAGGQHPDGSSSVNPLSYLMIEIIGALDQTHPSVYARLGSSSPDDFRRLCVTYLLHGQNRAQIYNDDACIPAIAAAGVPEADAAHYMAGGCMEISVQGKNCDLEFACTQNVAKTLELVLSGGIDLVTGERRLDGLRALPDYADFEELYAAFEEQLTWEYGQTVRALDIQSECYARYRPCFMLSSLLDDCLARGREQQAGGAVYHDYGFAALGVVNAADSLMGIKQAVFDERFVSAETFLAALRTDFAGHEPLRQRLRRLPKYGVEDAAADAMCDRVLRSVCTRATATRTRFGGRLKPMVFNFVWTPGASRELGARGDGSRAGKMISHGMTPQSSAMESGLTAALNSATSLTYATVSGGATTMWDMDEQWINSERMAAILRVFCERGGMIFQGNMTSVQQLEDALARPEDHANLIVRVGGFSARFVGLNAALQREIIARRRHRD